MIETKGMDYAKVAMQVWRDAVTAALSGGAGSKAVQHADEVLLAFESRFRLEASCGLKLEAYVASGRKVVGTRVAMLTEEHGLVAGTVTAYSDEDPRYQQGSKVEVQWDTPIFDEEKQWVRCSILGVIGKVADVKW